MNKNNLKFSLLRFVFLMLSTQLGYASESSLEENNNEGITLNCKSNSSTSGTYLNGSVLFFDKFTGTCDSPFYNYNGPDKNENIYFQFLGFGVGLMGFDFVDHFKIKCSNKDFLGDYEGVKADLLPLIGGGMSKVWNKKGSCTMSYVTAGVGGQVSLYTRLSISKKPLNSPLKKINELAAPFIKWIENKESEDRSCDRN